jgi:hypothetical protein
MRIDSSHQKSGTASRGHRPTAAPDVTAFVLGQLQALRLEAHRMVRLATDPGCGPEVSAAMDRLRRRLAAHVLVEGRLLLPAVRESGEQRALARLEAEHDRLQHEAAEAQDRGCTAAEVADLVRALQAHIDQEARFVRSASAATRERLAGVPPWQAAEYFECAGGPCDTWPSEWLG